MRNKYAIERHCAAQWASVLLLLFCAPIADAQLAPEPATVRIGVLSLFHPRMLVLSADRPVTLLLDATPYTLAPAQRATISASSGGLSVQFNDAATGSFSAQTVTLASSTFRLAVPDKLTRSYRGALSITARERVLSATVEMDTELAVASIVAAEAALHAPAEALKAQAIASRSFLLANLHAAHREIDACDTTHCQYLRSPPSASSAAWLATQATRGQVLTWHSSVDGPPRIVAAMYSRSCGGVTRVPSVSNDDRYPFYAVRCDYCRRHPERWTRSLAAPVPRSEAERIAYNRTHGWSAIPSNTHKVTVDSLEGVGTGHGIGLCQLGAADLAAHGASFRAILRLYFPNTAITTLR